MNSAEKEVYINLVLPENTSSDSPNSPDSNANIKASTSKGAIPKNNSTTRLSTTSRKSSGKNNNIDDLSLSCSQQLKERSQQNGYSECLSSQVPISYTSEVENAYSSEYFWKSKELLKEEPQFLTLDDLQTFNIPSASQFGKVKDSFNDYDLISKDFGLSDSSTEDNELLSISDDGCVYTFKGDQVADLPSSFFSLDIPIQASPDNLIQNRQRNNASPEMDYLEMDFDPGQLGDTDSDVGLNGDFDNDENKQSSLLQDVNIQDSKINLQEAKIEIFSKNLEHKTPSAPLEQEIQSKTYQEHILNVSSHTINSNNVNLPVEQKSLGKPLPDQNNKLISQIRRLRLPWLHSPNRINTNISSTEITSVMSSSSDFSSTSNGDNKAISEKKSTSKSCNSSPNDLNYNIRTRKVMLWSDEEASKKQVSQIGVSACGATAVLNVLKALRFPVPTPERIQNNYVNTRLRENSSPLPEYLLSRSIAGCTHEDIINGISKISNDELYCRFFHMYPERDFDLGCFLRFWIKNDAVAVATLNLQRNSKCINNGTVPDAWHHQMIYGVSSKGVHLTNPLECVDFTQIWPQLCSESVLLIKREDVLSRWNQKSDLPRLMVINNQLWRKLNVVGQVANMVRESRREFRPGFTNTTHIVIPAAYSSGITVVLRKSNPLYPLLRFCDELPLLNPLKITRYTEND